MNTSDNSGHRESASLTSGERGDAECQWGLSADPAQKLCRYKAQGSTGQLCVLLKLREITREWETPGLQSRGTLHSHDSACRNPLRKAPKCLCQGREGSWGNWPSVLHLGTKTVPNMCPTWRKATSPTPTGMRGMRTHLWGWQENRPSFSLAPGLTAAPMYQLKGCKTRLPEGEN